MHFLLIKIEKFIQEGRVQKEYLFYFQKHMKLNNSAY